MAPTDDFPHLLAPGRIGGLSLRNRILMCPMGDDLCEDDGTISANQAAYFEARARGGAALLLVGSVSIAYPRASFGRAPGRRRANDRYLPGLVDLADRVHRHGARIAAQLVHDGQMSLLDVARGLAACSCRACPSRRIPTSYSGMVTPDEIAAMMWPFTQPTSKVEYQVATEADIATVVEQFVDAADRCLRAGFDGIELHAGHGYLIDEFLTPSMNTRTDGWGGTVENRARLLLEVIRALRARLGDEFPLWIRINAVEHHKTDGETLRRAAAGHRAGRRPRASTRCTSPRTPAPTSRPAPTDGYAPHTYDAGRPGSLTRCTRRSCARRSTCRSSRSGGIEPDEAEAVLADGKADFVAMGRKLLADPDLPNKLREGRVDDIRPCIYQYRCIGNIFVKESLHCVANAQTGREHDLATSPSANPRHVLVVGGGAGRAGGGARARGSGHPVTLWEASERARRHAALRRPRRSAARALPRLAHPPGRAGRRDDRARPAGRRRRRARARGRRGRRRHRRDVGASPTSRAPTSRTCDRCPSSPTWLDDDDDTRSASGSSSLGGGKAGHLDRRPVHPARP